MTSDEAFATWFFLEFGYRPRPGMIGVDSHRSAFEAGRNFGIELQVQQVRRNLAELAERNTK